MFAHPDQVLTRRTAALLILIGGAAFCAFLVLFVVIDPADRMVTQPSSYSRSAVGHAALAGLLREAGHDVQVNRSPRGRGVSPGDVLLILEPHLGRYAVADVEAAKDVRAVADLQRLMDGKRHVLVALPKWQPTLSSSAGTRPGWIDAATLLSKRDPANVARGAVATANVERHETGEPWIDGLGMGLPTIDESPQLITGARLAPLISNAEGILVGELTDGGDARIVVLADPDIIANHGLHRGDNARLALGLIERLKPSSDSTIHFDETLHGFAIVPSLPRLLMSPPFLAVTLLVFGAVAITVWRAAVGFGTSRSSDDGKPVYGSGHATLLRNAGRLLAGGGHGAFVADRYASASLEEAARRLHLVGQGRSDEKDTDMRDMLLGIAQRRGVRARLPDAAERPLARARGYYDWIEEMFHGS